MRNSSDLLKRKRTREENRRPNLILFWTKLCLVPRPKKKKKEERKRHCLLLLHTGGGGEKNLLHQVFSPFRRWFRQSWLRNGVGYVSYFFSLFSFQLKPISLLGHGGKTKAETTKTMKKKKKMSRQKAKESASSLMLLVMLFLAGKNVLKKPVQKSIIFWLFWGSWFLSLVCVLYVVVVVVTLGLIRVSFFGVGSFLWVKGDPQLSRTATKEAVIFLAWSGYTKGKKWWSLEQKSLLFSVEKVLNWPWKICEIWDSSFAFCPFRKRRTKKFCFEKIMSRFFSKQETFSPSSSASTFFSILLPLFSVFFFFSLTFSFFHLHPRVWRDF